MAEVDDGVVAVEAAELGPPVFRLTVALPSVQIARTDGAEEDDFKTWAETRILEQNGADWSDAWYTAADEAASGPLWKTSVTNGFKGGYNYSRNSKEVPVTEGLLKMLGAKLQLRVFKGGARDAGSDELLGSCELPLQALLTGKTISKKLSLAPPVTVSEEDAAAPYSGAIRVRVQATSALAEARAGGRYFSLTGASLSGVPFRWTTPDGDEGDERKALADPATEAALTQEDHEARAAACQDHESNGFRYAIVANISSLGQEDVATPRLATAAAEPDAAEPATPKPESWEIVFGGGVLCYDRVDTPKEADSLNLSSTKVDDESAAAAAAAAADDGGSDAAGGAADSTEGGEEASPPARWQWSIKWPETSGSSCAFLSKAAVAGLVAHARAGGKLPVQLRRVTTAVVEEEELISAMPADAVFGVTRGLRPVLEDWEGRGCADLSLAGLLVEGEASAVSGGGLQGQLVSETDRAHAEAAAEAREAAWAEWEATQGGASGGKGGKKGGKGGKKKAAPKKKDAKGGKGKASKKGAKGSAAAGGGDEDDTDDASPPLPLLNEAAASLTVTLTMNESLVLPVPAPPVPELAASDLIPARPPPPRGDVGLGATEEFRRDVMLAAHAIAEKYGEVAATYDGGQASSAEVADARRRALLAELNESGVYLAMKERLKRAAVRVVRERFRDAPASVGGAGDTDKDAFVSQLYTFLVGQVGRALNAVFDAADAEAAAAAETRSQASRQPAGASGFDGSRNSSAGSSPRPGLSSTAALARELAGLEAGVSRLLVTAPPSSPLASSTPKGHASFRPGDAASDGGASHDASLESDSERLERLAAEAEFRGDVAAAEQCHQSRVAAMEEAAIRGAGGGIYDPTVWLAYASFLCRQGVLDKATEAAREAVSINAAGEPQLRLLSAISLLRGQVKDASILVKDAVRAAGEKQRSLWTELEGACGGAVPGYEAGVVGARTAGDSFKSDGVVDAGEEGKDDEDDDGEEGLRTAGRMHEGGGERLLVQELMAAQAVSGWASAAEEEAITRVLAARVLESQGEVASATVAAMLRAAVALQTAATAMRARAEAETATLRGVEASWAAGVSSATTAEEREAAEADALAGGMAAATDAELDCGAWSAQMRLASWALHCGLPELAGMALEASKTSLSDQPVSMAVRVEQLTLSGRVALAAAANGVSGGLQAVVSRSLARAATSSSSESPVKASSSTADEAGVSEALVLLEEATAADPHCSAAWAATADALLCTGQLREARLALERSVGSWDSKSDSTEHTAAEQAPTDHKVLLRLGEAYAAQHERGMDASMSPPLVSGPTPRTAAQTAGASSRPGTGVLVAGAETLAASAHEVFLRAAAVCGWATAWAGAGRAALLCGDVGEAEAALSEANIRDTTNPAVWAWLCSVCLASRPVRDAEAASSLDQGLRCGLAGATHSAVLQRISSQYERQGKLAVAEAVLRRALSDCDNASVRLRLGGVLIKAGRLEEAEEELKDAVRLSSDTSVQEEATRQMQEAQRRMGKRVTAPGAGSAAGAGAHLRTAESLAGDVGDDEDAELDM